MKEKIKSYLQKVCHLILSKLDSSYFPYRSVNYDKLVESIGKQSDSGRVYLYNSIVERADVEDIHIIKTALKKRRNETKEK